MKKISSLLVTSACIVLWSGRDFFLRSIKASKTTSGFNFEVCFFRVNYSKLNRYTYCPNDLGDVQLQYEFYYFTDYKSIITIMQSSYSMLIEKNTDCD